MKYDNKNFILAIVLSMAIIFGWQYFYAKPQADRLAEQAQQAQQAGGQQPGTPSAPAGNAGSGTVPVTGQATALPREQALAATPRVKIDTAYVSGSVNLKGGLIDDLHLLRYRETVNPKSPTITLLSPAGTQGATFAEQGLIPAPGTAAKLPTSETQWSAPDGATLTENTPLVLTWDNGEGLVFTRQIEIGNEYVFSITQGVENRGTQAVSLQPYARVIRWDTPPVAGWWVFFEGMLGWAGDKLQEINYDAASEATEPMAFESTGGWLGFTDKYWAAVAIPDQTRSVTSTFAHLKSGNRDVYTTDYVIRDAITVLPGASASYQDQLYAGAKVVRVIDAVGAKYNIVNFDFMIDWGWFWFLTKPMFYLIDYLQGLVGNFGIAILLATVLVKLLVFPLANKSYASMSKMKKLQPEMLKLKELYPDDKMKQQQEMMALYKREKVNPMSGCLPVLVQIPIFFALYKVILTSIELRHAPFFGWIHDLSAPDPTSLFNLFGLIPWTPPHMLMIGIWPIIMGITMWIQMRLNPAPPDPVQATLFNWMPVMFTFMLGTFPAGLVIYWAWSNTLSILQQSYIMKRHGTEVDILGNIRESLPFLKKKQPS